MCIIHLLFQNLKSMWRLTECNTWLWPRWCRPCWPDSRRRWIPTPAEPGCPHWCCPGRSPAHWWGGVSLHTDCPLLEWWSPPGALKIDPTHKINLILTGYIRMKRDQYFYCDSRVGTISVQKEYHVVVSIYWNTIYIASILVICM